MTLTEPRTLPGAADLAIPAPGDWQIDPSHSSVEFVARHLVVAKTRGRFADFDGVVHIGDDPLDSSVEVAIRTASVDTGDETRDGHLQSPDFFDVENHSEMTFRSTGFEHVGGERGVVHGELTILGVTNPVDLDLEFLGLVTDPWGGERAGYSASTEIDREDWGLTWNQALEAGGVVVGKKVRIELEIETVKS
jgi:polyisoprenoid-binding protein YceI